MNFVLILGIFLLTIEPEGKSCIFIIGRIVTALLLPAFISLEIAD